MNVFEKLLHVQTQLRAPKNQYNKFGNYYYRNCEDIQEAAKPLLQEVKATLVVGDELLQISERFYIKATARFIDCESGEEISNMAYAREDLEKKGMDVSQVTGSTSSYARKYALNGLFCIDDVKDADNQDNTGKGKAPAGSAKANKKASENSKTRRDADKASEGADADTERMLGERIDQAKLDVIRSELERTGLEDKVVLSLFKLKKLEEVTNGQFKAIMVKFKATPSREG